MEESGSALEQVPRERCGISSARDLENSFGWGLKPDHTVKLVMP